jgi:hypothetical protein
MAILVQFVSDVNYPLVLITLMFGLPVMSVNVAHSTQVLVM